MNDVVRLAHSPRGSRMHGDAAKHSDATKHSDIEQAFRDVFRTW